jgi:membrane protein
MMIKLVKDAFIHFLNSNTFQKGASLAYYTVFSFVPIIIVIISLLGFFFGEQAVSGEIYYQLNKIFGNDASMQIQEIIKNHHINHNSLTTTFIGFAVLIFSASQMFNEIHDSFNSIWSIKGKLKNSIFKYFSTYLASFLILILSFFIILISTLVSSFLIKYSHNFHFDYEFLYVYEHCLSFATMSIVFTTMFKFLSDAKLHWKPTYIGGLITSSLFIFGKIIIAWYIGYNHLSSTFGSAIFIVVLLLWVYYTSQILFLGASFVKVISEKLGFEITVKNHIKKDIN